MFRLLPYAVIWLPTGRLTAFLTQNNCSVPKLRQLHRRDEPAATGKCTNQTKSSISHRISHINASWYIFRITLIHASWQGYRWAQSPQVCVVTATVRVPHRWVTWCHSAAACLRSVSALFGFDLCLNRSASRLKSILVEFPKTETGRLQCDATTSSRLPCLGLVWLNYSPHVFSYPG